MQGETATTRKVLRLTGADRAHFLQGLITKDIAGLDAGAIYAALLTPQGKYLADFFLLGDGDSILIDVDASLAGPLVQRLNMYRLRADVTISETPLHVLRGTGPVRQGAYADPRHPALGWRACSQDPGDSPVIDWDSLRVAHLIPETGVELVPNETYVLEAGFERLHGVDFRKGCYVGQEVTARMKHKTALAKGLMRVSVSQVVPVGTPITAEGRAVGTLYTQAGGKGIAYLRFDRATGTLEAGGARIGRVDG